MVVAAVRAGKAEREFSWKQWEWKSKKCRDDLKLPLQWHPWNDRGAQFRGLPSSPRMRELCNVAFGAQLKAQPDQSAALSADPNLYVDASQCVLRKLWGEDLHCLTSSSVLYSFGSDKVLDSYELLALCGCPAEQGMLAALSYQEVIALVGQSMSLFSLAPVMLSVYLQPDGPWMSGSPLPSASRLSEPSGKKRRRMCM